MYFKIACANCAQQLTASEEIIGRRVRCPYCQSVTVVAAPQPAEPPQETFAADIGELSATSRRSPRTSPRKRRKESESDGTNASVLIAALVGLGVTVLFYLALMPFPRSYFNGLFWQRGWVPFVEAFLMFWSFAILAFKAKIFSRQKQSMLLEVLPVSISADINAERLPEFTEHIRKLPIPPNESFLINRVLRGLEHFRVRGSASEVANMLESQSEIDATSVGASYTLVKVFIWAIPILGFIGTVQGLGDAVGGFSGKMAGATDISVVKDSLGDITKGLGVAFDTTLIALVMSLLLMLPMSTLEKNEEDLLNSVDEYCNENLLKRLDDGGGGGGGGSGGIDQKVLEKAINAAMAQQQAELAAWTKKLEAIAGTLARQVIEGWKSVNELQAAQHQKQLVADKAAAETILAQQHELLSELVSVHKSLSERSETMKSSAEAEIAATQDQLQLLRESVISLNSVLGELGGRQIVVENRASLSGGKRRWPWGSNGG